MIFIWSMRGAGHAGNEIEHIERRMLRRFRSLAFGRRYVRTLPPVSQAYERYLTLPETA